MHEIRSNKLRGTPQLLVWMLGLIVIALVGVSLVADLSGVSPADQFVVFRWGFAGLRIYLWLEGLLLAGFVSALGAHIISTGFAVTRGNRSGLFGDTIQLDPRMPRHFGYVFVVLGAALVALSITTLLLLNTCRYMRVI